MVGTCPPNPFHDLWPPHLAVPALADPTSPSGSRWHTSPEDDAATNTSGPLCWLMQSFSKFSLNHLLQVASLATEEE